MDHVFHCRVCLARSFLSVALTYSSVRFSATRELSRHFELVQRDPFVKCHFMLTNSSVSKTDVKAFHVNCSWTESYSSSTRPPKMRKWGTSNHRTNPARSNAGRCPQMQLVTLSGLNVGVILTQRGWSQCTALALVSVLVQMHCQRSNIEMET
jgi:hypothetical protein